MPLSMIAEESKVLVIPSVRFAPLVAANISEIFISSSFMLLIPSYEIKTPPLLFNHNGDLITHCNPGDETYKVLNAVINDHDSTIIMLTEGLHWYSYHIPANNASEHNHLHGEESLVFLDSEKFILSSHYENKYWIESGSLYSQHRRNIITREGKDPLNYVYRADFLKRENKVIVSTPFINDTVYLFDHVNHTLIPLVGFFSKPSKTGTNMNTGVIPDIAALEERYIHRYYRTFVLYCQDRYLLELSWQQATEYLFFNQSTREGFRTTRLTDDFRGGISFELSALMRNLPNWGFKGNSDYLVYWFSKKEMEKRHSDRLRDTDNNSEHLQSLRRLMSECDDNDLIVFINKLKM
ncbi:MAG: hypothetical protein FJY11_03800 [Bacteroidetes bacterium]|nr:hypothetical protein [Bacteroidota bacterium]